MSAIATNGSIQGGVSDLIMNRPLFHDYRAIAVAQCLNFLIFFIIGKGPYYIISRNLGVELGGAIGTLFYLGITASSTL